MTPGSKLLSGMAVLLGVILLLAVALYAGVGPWRETAAKELVWQVLSCTREREGAGQRLEADPWLQAAAEELLGVYREKGQAEATRQAQAQGYQVDFRVILLRADEPERAERSPCGAPWFAPVPGSPDLPPRDDPDVRRVGLAVERIDFRGEEALLSVLVWREGSAP